MSDMGNVELVVKARCYVYTGGGIKSLPDDVLHELLERGWMVGQSPMRVHDVSGIGISIRHGDTGGRWFIHEGDSILFLDDDRFHDFESVRVDWVKRGER